MTTIAQQIPKWLRSMRQRFASRRVTNIKKSPNSTRMTRQEALAQWVLSRR